MLTIQYCEKCKQQISEYGDIAFSLFSFACEQFYKNDPLEVSTDLDDFPNSSDVMIKFLENKGFIITTESSKQTIQIKPLGLKCYIDDFNKVCRFCLHEELVSDSFDS